MIALRETGESRPPVARSSWLERALSGMRRAGLVHNASYGALGNLTVIGFCSYFVLVMPQPNRKHVYLLSQAEEHSRYAAIWCRYCKKRRYFLLAELRQAFGDIDCDGIVDQLRWRCTSCDGKGRLDLRLGDPPANGEAKLRRLVRVDIVRRPIWRDEDY